MATYSIATITATISGTYLMNSNRLFVIQPATNLPSVIPVPFGAQQYVPANVQQSQGANSSQGELPEGISTGQQHHEVELWVPIFSSLLGAALITFLLAYVVNRLTWRIRLESVNSYHKHHKHQQSWSSFWIFNAKYYCPNHERTVDAQGKCPVSKKTVPLWSVAFSRTNPIRNWRNYRPGTRDQHVDVFPPQPPSQLVSNLSQTASTSG
ncbi:hypothetical protein BT63DRAFT_419985 [Microthyrium microscopicum]|uniref:Uncharacterized protein n=1 Tax=Microthyrium microscopicum TaxID=703497 RepID=A0A6A6UTF5_9PEZI|nr:hypothetical protein BT63DRAFT_419985 [Microthyrium microscopicum]